jgi:hypothetical protein
MDEDKAKFESESRRKYEKTMFTISAIDLVFFGSKRHRDNADTHPKA